MNIGKTYNPSEIEQKWYRHWEENHYFTPPDIDKSQKPFTVLIPPPNVTGILHVGHVLNNTLQDIAVRYKRMTGVPTLWIPGMDHAGIATQNVVEKDLAKQGLDRHALGREKLIEKIWEWKEQKGGKIVEQLRLLGASCDWTRERFTLDEGLSRAVKEVFVSLYEKGLIYQGEYIINWCPRCVSALSNDEVDHYDEQGKLWYIRYPLDMNNGHSEQEDTLTYLTIATTRPETMLGDVAVAVNPDDPRYAHLAGKMVELPYTNRKIPILLDDYVDKDFGTGVVKITPAHDPNDFEVGRRHNLTPLSVMDEKGVMNEAAGEIFAGMDRFECREKLIKMLSDDGLLDKINDHELAIGKCYRCDSIVEPYLSKQWFVKMKPLSKRAIEAVENNEITLQPERWKKVFMHWMNNIRDWCISRQIWWGHRIPVYYCIDCDRIMVKTEDPKVCSGCGSNNIRQDEDVLDTWFSSWLWPFSTMGWPEKSPDLEYYLPTNLLVTAPEIIYLWVARMIMATYEFCDCKPFDTVLLHGTVRDELGRKMSKSLGNSPDPIEIIEQVGADALRFSMVFNTPKGADIYYSEAVLENGRNFCNKIWNAYRYIMTNAADICPENADGEPISTEAVEMTELADRWIYSRLNEVIEQTAEYYEDLRYNDAAQLLQEFIWKEFCSWYLELTKPRVYAKDENSNRALKIRRQVIAMLLDILQQSMKLLHPVMPFITEEIWQGIKQVRPTAEEALIISSFPKVQAEMIDNEIREQMSLIQDSITAIRNLRKQVNIPPGAEVAVLIRVSSDQKTAVIKDNYDYFSKLAKVSELEAGTGISKPKGSIASALGDLEVYLKLSGVIDIEREKLRLNKILAKTGKELERTDKKLSNPNFLSKAKEEVVKKERAKKEEMQLTFDKNKQLLKDIENL